MITDDNKGITGIDYNLLNLPSSIQINGGTSATTGELEYTYDAAGTKLTKTVTGSTVPATNYVGNHIYKGNNLAYILTEEACLTIVRAVLYLMEIIITLSTI